MNTHNDNPDLKQLRHMKLSASSRERMERDLRAYAQLHGVREAEPGRSIEQVPFGTSLFTRLVHIRPMTAALLAITLVLGAGTSYAAENAVPGDLLYPVKVEVNENIKTALAFSNEAEAKLQAHLVQERLKEARELASRGELNAEASAEISTRVRHHYDEAVRESTAAHAAGDVESSATVRAELEGTLRTYADVLSSLNARIEGNDSATLVTDIESFIRSTAQVQATATADVNTNTQSEVEAIIERAQQVVASTQTTLERAEDELSASAYARLEARLEQAVSAHAQAQAQIRTQMYREAYASAHAALRIANEVRTLIESTLNTNIEFEIRSDDSNGSIIEVRTETRTDTDARTDTGSDDGDESNGAESTIDLDLDVDAQTDTSVDTGSIETNIETDTSVRSGTGLSL